MIAAVVIAVFTCGHLAPAEVLLGHLRLCHWLHRCSASTPQCAAAQPGSLSGCQSAAGTASPAVAACSTSGENATATSPV